MAKPINQKPIQAPAAQETQEATQPTQTARVYKGEQVLDHDLFKLLPATMMKNVSYTDKPDYAKIEHCHIFHTIDSSGKRQDACNAVGGHLHLVTVTHNYAGVPSLEVSGPVRYVKQKNRGVYSRVAVPMEDDTHTHEVQYLGSEKIQMRKPNMEFAKLDAIMRAKQDITVPGVISG